MSESNNGTTTWLKTLIAPLLSAVITGIIMYVAVRVELSANSARQGMIITNIQALQVDINANKSEMTLVRERLAALEVTVKKNN